MTLATAWTGYGWLMVLLLVGSFLLAYVFTRGTIRAALHLGLVDRPNARKVHQQPTPRIGGLAVAAALGLTCFAGWLTLWLMDLDFQAGFVDQVIVAATAVTLLLIVGLTDDVRTVSSQFKLLSLLVASVALYGGGLSLDRLTLPGLDAWSLGYFALPATVVWVLAAAVSMNFIDGLDGLCSGIGILASAVLAVVLLAGGFVMEAVVPVALVGALGGFLVLNSHPAKIFLGDVGSLLVGATLAIGVLLANDRVGTMQGLVLPALAMCIPLADAAVTMLRRKFVQRQSMLSAERGHIHHHLLDQGLTQRQAVFTLYAVSVAGVAIGLVAMLIDGWAKLAVLILLGPLLYGLFRFAGSYRTREMISAICRTRFIDRVHKTDEDRFQEALLRFRAAHDFQAWWAAVCQAAQAFGFLKIELPVIQRGGDIARMHWPTDEPQPAPANDKHGQRNGKHNGQQNGHPHTANGTSKKPEKQKAETDDAKLSAVIPIRDRRSDRILQASVQLDAAHSLELAGRRLALFSRLLGEHAVADLRDTRGKTDRHDEWNRLRRRGDDLSTDPNNADSPSDSNADRHHTSEPCQNGHHVNGEADRAQTADANDRRGSRLSHLIGWGWIRSRRREAAKRKRERAAKESKQIIDPREMMLETRPQLPALDPSNPLAGLRVAVVHDFLYVYAGAERVLEQIIEVLPQCDVFALFDFLPEHARGFLRGKPVVTSFLQKLPLAKRKHRAFLPIMPLAIEQLDLSGYDLVVSSSYIAAKGVITGPDQLHVCYCHSPARYAWDLQHQYLQRQKVGFGPKGMLTRAILQYIRNWDSRTAMGVDRFVANSKFISRRIQKVYRRDAKVIYPPVDTELFRPGTERSDFYLTVSRLVPYKRIDIIVDAFKQMPNRKLIVVGDGPQMEELQEAAGPNVAFVGHQPEDQLLRYMQLAKAFVFAAEEDFGIVPVEAMACGVPVIAYGAGGVCESVQSGETGIFFDQQTAASIVEAVNQFESKGVSMDQDGIRQRARSFSAERFRGELRELIAMEWDNFYADRDQDEMAGMHFEEAEERETALT